MPDIEITAIFGEETKKVILSKPFGAGGVYFITINNYHQGQVVNTSEGWRVYLNAKSELSLEDCEVILELVMNNER